MCSTGCPENLQDPLYFYKIQPREKGGMWKVMEGLGKVVGRWNEARECLGPLQNSKLECEMVGVAPQAWRSILVK